VPDSPEIRKLLPDVEFPHDVLPVAVNLSEYLLSYPIALFAAACPSSIVCTMLVEYFNYRCSGLVEPLCATFVTRTVAALGRGNCSGIRANLKAIRKFGIPAISMCESSNSKQGSFTNPIQFGYADEFRTMHYVRLGNQVNAASPVPILKSWLAGGFPIAFGFSVPSSLDCNGYIDYRPTFDSIQGGHAALLVGFDDKQLSASRGAFRVYCPWGSDWGDQGIGWLPYAFVERRMALDFWTIIKPEWASSGELCRST
jgi:hypothetical protein